MADDVSEATAATGQGAAQGGSQGQGEEGGGAMSQEAAANALFGGETTEQEQSDAVALEGGESDSDAADTDDGGEFDALKPDTEVPEKPFEGDVGEGYKLKLIPGLNADNPEIKEFVQLMKSSDVKPEKAQAMFDMFVENRKRAIKDTHEYELKFREELNTQWIKENKTDPEFGKDNYDASIKYAQAALRKFVPKEELSGNSKKLNFVQLIQQGNLKNCPPFFRFLTRVGKYISEATPVATRAAVSKGTKFEDISAEDALFGSLGKGK